MTPNLYEPNKSSLAVTIRLEFVNIYMERSQASAVVFVVLASQPIPRPCFKVYMRFLIINDLKVYYESKLVST
jgi:hypothetical protein